MCWVSVVGDGQECFPEHPPPAQAGVQQWEKEAGRQAVSHQDALRDPHLLSVHDDEQNNPCHG